MIRRNPNITLCELWYKLRVNRGYSRHIGSLYRVLRRIDFYKEINIKNTSRYVPKKYYTPANTVDFVKRCICYYSYKPLEIQTDNGMEFTWNQEKTKKLHPLDNLCLKLDIDHHKIRPRTSRHNVKVERSHRNDNERFYNTLNFDSLNDLREKGKKYLKRFNQIPMAVLDYKTSIEKRQELIFFCLTIIIHSFL